MTFQLGIRRGQYVDITQSTPPGTPLTAVAASHFETLDLVYRASCALLYNYVPLSGHPGGSISAGRFVAGLVFGAMDYDLERPERQDADILSFAAGHKAMGLYAMWALRDEVARLGARDLLPDDVRDRLRLEDLVGFRRNPTTGTPLFRRFGAKALDGHPTPATPFVRLATGASGVGVATSLGLAFAARDLYGTDAPRVHIVEGEGGLTPGRVAEALAAAGTASLGNAILHLDWNQASIDTNLVCRANGTPGEYVQWNPTELFLLHDWNVVFVPDGTNVQQIHAAQRMAVTLDNGQPTAVVYRTTKGWQYGIEGRSAHGAGHPLCSDGFCHALAGLTGLAGRALHICPSDEQSCRADPNGDAILEGCLWDSLQMVRGVMAGSQPMVDELAQRLRIAQARLNARARTVRAGAPNLAAAYELAAREGDRVPVELAVAPGASTTLRGELSRALHRLNETSNGAFLAAAADLLGSTSVNAAADGFPPGFWNAATNPEARLLATGGICEDAMSGILAGISTFGHHVGVGASYAAFLAPLGHIAARLHAIGNQAERERTGAQIRPMILVCAHAGLKTGEDGPTHADPQPLQLLQENFPPGMAVTLTPWDPMESWPLLCAALNLRPAVIAPFVTRPSERVLDRAALGLAPPEAAVSGVYLLRPPEGRADVTLVLQESAVTYAFLEEALPRLLAEGVDPRVYYVASAELFDALPLEEQRRVFPEEHAQEALGITGFTLPTLYRWIRSDRGRAASLHPFQHGHFLGSGTGEKVLAEAGLDGTSQYHAIRRYLDLATTPSDPDTGGQAAASPYIHA